MVLNLWEVAFHRPIRRLLVEMQRPAWNSSVPEWQSTPCWRILPSGCGARVSEIRHASTSRNIRPAFAKQ